MYTHSANHVSRSVVAHLDAIYHGLYVGDQKIAENQHWLRDNGIKVVINVADKKASKAQRSRQIDGISYTYAGIDDDGRGDVAKLFNELVQDGLLGHVAAGRRIIIHCKHGRNR
jgi:hypothetical protein